MAAGEAPIKQAVAWIDDRLRDDPRADRLRLVDEAARRFDLSPLDTDFLFAPPGRRARRPRERAQARRVQEQFGAHRRRLRDQRRSRGRRRSRPDRRLGPGPGPRPRARPGHRRRPHRAGAGAGIARHVTAYDVTEPMLRAARGSCASAAPPGAFVAGDVAGAAVPRRRLRRGDVPHRRPPLRRRRAPPCARSAACCAPGGSFLLQDILGHDDAEAGRVRHRGGAAARSRRTSGPIAPSSGRPSCAPPGSP